MTTGRINQVAIMSLPAIQPPAREGTEGTAGKEIALGANTLGLLQCVNTLQRTLPHTS